MAITNAWDEASPGGGEDAGGADDEIRQLKLDTREQLVDGNHDDISVNTTSGAKHVATDANSEFPIYNSTATTKYHGFGNATRNFGDGTRNDHVFETVYELSALSIGVAATAATIALEDDSAYFLQASLSVWDNGGTGHAIVQHIGLVRRSGGGAATLVDENEITSAPSGYATVAFVASGNNVLVRVTPVSQTTSADISLHMLYFRAVA